MTSSCCTINGINYVLSFSEWIREKKKKKFLCSDTNNPTECTSMGEMFEV